MNKEIPQVQEIEASVLGAMLLDPDTIPKVFSILKPEHFYNAKNRIVFNAMTLLYEANQPIDIVTVYEQLKKTGEVKIVGGAVYISRLAEIISSSANIEYHSAILIDKWILRELIFSANYISDKAYAGSEDAVELTEEALNKIFNITNVIQRKEERTIKAVSKDAMNQIDLAYSGEYDNYFVKSGYYDLDEMIVGFERGNYYIVAARPSMGKTAFGLGLASNASDNGHNVGFFSMEMKDIDLYFRRLCAETGIEFNKIKRGKVNNNEREEILKATRKINIQNIIIDDTPSLSPIELKSKAKRMLQKYKIDIIVVDYLQYIFVKNKQSREQEVSTASRTLKDLAKELNIPVIALAQLNRAVESRTDKTPMLSDLRDSGSIEQDADCIIFLHRPEYYGTDFVEGTLSTKNLAYAVVAKQRNGATGTLKLTFLKEQMKFESYKPVFMLTQNSYNKEN